MLNFIIDASVLALAAKTKNPEKEEKYLYSLINNFYNLKKLQNNDTVTISYMNNIWQLLKQNNFLYTEIDIKDRINELIEKKPDLKKEMWHDGIFEDWDALLFKIKPPPKKFVTGNIRKKGNIGIFNNIPNRDDDPSDDYITNTTFKDEKQIFNNLPYAFCGTLKKYCGYMADLNQKYHCHDNNFIVLGENFQNMEKENVNITLNENGANVQSCVAIVGIGKAYTLCPPKIKIKTLTDACNNAQTKFSAKLDFGRKITNENIKKDLSSQAGPPEKIYGYLETLYQITDIIINKKINITNDNTVIEMLNAYGLLCSSDDNKYSNYKCIYREFEDKTGKKLFFNVHLKPSTYTYTAPEEDDEYYKLASQYTVRIYLCWNGSDRKFIIGWIGHHPFFCKDCVNTKCPKFKQRWILL